MPAAKRAAASPAANDMPLTFSLIIGERQPCVARGMGDWELGHKDAEHRNLKAWITMLRSGMLIRECNGIPTTRQDILQAIARLNDKAVAFQKKFFGKNIVELKACDFRLDPKVDRSARVALCEDPNLSVRHVGQPVLALLLDKTKLRAMDRDEFRCYLVSLGAFYDIENATSRAWHCRPLPAAQVP